MTVLLFNDVLRDVSRSVRRIPQKEFLDIGLYPIVDQGQQLIAGYSNEETGLCFDVPVIVFGDHTRCVKYMEKPFAAGADGVKILKCVRGEDNPRYFYHALRAADIPSLGYSRHFKLVKELQFVVPERRRQNEIIDNLDAVEMQQAMVEEQLKMLDELVKSRFVEMFGNPRDNDKGWKEKPLVDVCETRLGKMLDAKKQTGQYLYPYLANANVQWFKFDLSNLSEMDFVEADRAEFELRDGDVLATEGGEVGRCAIWRCELENCYFQKAIHRIRCDARYLIPEYFVWAFKMKSDYGLFDPYTTKSTIAHLTGKKIKQVPLQLPPLALQQEFAAFVQQVDKLKSSVQQQIDKLQLLYDSLAQEYFGGE